MATWMVPLACQCICPALLFASMIFCPESPRWLAAQDDWDSVGVVLADVRHLPVEHPYIQQEILDLRTQLEHEKEVMQGAGFWDLQKECWTMPTNRKRALLTIGMITFQQWTGVSCLMLVRVVRGTNILDWCYQLLCSNNFQRSRSFKHNNESICPRDIWCREGRHLLDLCLPPR